MPLARNAMPSRVMRSPVGSAAALYMLLAPVWLAAQGPTGFIQHEFPAPSGYNQQDFPTPSGYRQADFPAPSGYKQNDFPAPSGYKQNDFGPPQGFKSPGGASSGFKPPRDFALSSGRKPTGGGTSASQPAVQREVPLPEPDNPVKVGRITITGADRVIPLRASSPETAIAGTAVNPPAAVKMDKSTGTERAIGAVNTGQPTPEGRAKSRQTPRLAARLVDKPEPQRGASRVWEQDPAGWHSSTESLLLLLAAFFLVAFLMFLLFGPRFEYRRATEDRKGV